MTDISLKPSRGSSKDPSLKSLPGPSPHWLLGVQGNALQFIGDPIAYADRLFKQYGPIVSMVKGGRGANVLSPENNCPGSVFIMGPELSYNYATNHYIYRKYALTGMLYRRRNDSARTQPLQHFLTGLFNTTPEEHRQQRHMLMPAFAKKRMQAYHHDMVGITQAVFETWQVGQSMNVSNAMRTLTARIATKTLIGQDAQDAQDAQGDSAVAHTIATLQRVNKALSNPLTSLAPLDIPGLPYHRFLDGLLEFDSEMRAIIALKRAAGVDTGDILSVLLQMRVDETDLMLSEQALLGHIGVIFSAAHETSSNTLDWTLLLLAQFPAVAAQLLDELESVLHGDAPTFTQLPQLVFLERVIKESMRLIPVAPLIWKALTQDTDVGGHFLPAQTVVYHGVYHTQHMPALYSDPNAFKPERWETISPSIAEYCPFGGGSRMCIGASFAMAEIKIVLAILLQRFRMQCVPNARIDRFGFVTIAPKGGLHMTINRQDRQFRHGVGGIRGNVRQMVDLPA
jgi:cytochrome P450